jgi:WD40 repeat protein
MNSPANVSHRLSFKPSVTLRLFVFLGLIACFIQPARAQTGTPSHQPTLRIETGVHTASINRIGVDEANRYLVTGSDDKTARVWELSTGKLLRTIRAPIGMGDEGKLYSVAITPDGATVAASGWTRFDWEDSHSIYLFDRETGRLTQRVDGMPNVVLHLVYSSDGRYLAATLGGKNGVRVFRTSDYTQVGSDEAYGNQSYSADFDRAGRLVTGCDDNFVRLYAPVGNGALRLLAKQNMEGDPQSVRFSPDGTRVAVGFYDAARVAVLSGRDLSTLYAPDTTGINSGDFSCVSWSADGQTLYSGGTALDSNNRKFIRAWGNGGRAAYRDYSEVAATTIMHILPLRDGGIVYGTADPAFGALDAGGRRVVFAPPAIADYRNNRQGFMLAADGTGVAFSYELFGKAPARFSLADRRLEVGPEAGSGNWRAPVTEVAGLSVTNWQSTYEPKLNGTTLKLRQFERSRSVAIAPDGNSFLLGADFYLRLFDRSGTARWEMAIPGTAWAVNVTPDGRFGVVAYADGTIRWHSMKTGRELLAFFPHADRKRWVVWTPSGYYDTSAGAEGLIGWHVNNGRDQAADFFPVGQFREAFYRPDVVSRILKTGDEQVALREANEDAGRRQQQTDVAKLLPPVIEIISPTDGAEINGREIVVRYQLRTPSGEPVTEVRALVDGRPAAAERGLSLQSANASGNTRELRVQMPEGDSQISIIAANRFATSVPATVRVRGAKPQPTRDASAKSSARTSAPEGVFEVKPKLYVLAVGVSAYSNASYNLGYPAKDAKDFAAALERQKGGLYREVVVKVLTDGQATKDDVLDGLDWIRKETTAKDVAVVLLAGHGVNDPTGAYYFLPFNADPDRLLRTGVKWSDIRDTVAAIPGKVLFFVDTCHSGNVLGTTRRGIQDDLTGPINELASAENGAIVFAASTGKQYSLEKPEWNNGAFTKAVVEALDGRADYTGRGRITINMLDLYISERVKELTRGSQTPTTAKPSTVPDFPVALKR